MYKTHQIFYLFKKSFRGFASLLHSTLISAFEHFFSCFYFCRWNKKIDLNAISQEKFHKFTIFIWCALEMECGINWIQPGEKFTRKNNYQIGSENIWKQKTHRPSLTMLAWWKGARLALIRFIFPFNARSSASRAYRLIEHWDLLNSIISFIFVE